MTIEQAINAMNGTPAKLCFDAVFVFGGKLAFDPIKVEQFMQHRGTPVRENESIAEAVGRVFGAEVMKCVEDNP